MLLTQWTFVFGDFVAGRGVVKGVLSICRIGVLSEGFRRRGVVVGVCLDPDS